MKQVRFAEITLACLGLGACFSAKRERPLYFSFKDLFSAVKTKSGIALDFDSTPKIGGLSRLIAFGDRLHNLATNLSDHSVSLADLLSLGNNGNFSSPKRHAKRIDFSRGCNAAYGGQSHGGINNLPLDGYLLFYSVRARGRTLIGSVFEALIGTKLEHAMKEGTVSKLARQHFKGDSAARNQPVSRTASH